MVVYEFFAERPVFRHEEFVAFHAHARGRSERTSQAVLAQHVAAGHLIRIKQGLYATVPRGIKPEGMAVDPYLLASRMADDAVVAYHAALQFHGRAYSVWQRFPFLTRHRLRPARFRDAEFVPLEYPAAIKALRDLGGGIDEVRHAGSTVRVTTLERTLVDTLAAPEHGGDWEEIWRSLESVEFFDLDFVIAYALKFETALLAARVGFFLEQHRETLMVEEHHLTALKGHRPKAPLYFDRRLREPGRFMPAWNLIVPERIQSRSWAEVT